MTAPSGARVLVTRARDQAGTLTSLLQEAGLQVVAVPTIELHDPEDWGAADRAIARLADYRLVIFTSANGVERFWRRIKERGADGGALSGRALLAIGPATAAALQDRGLAVQSVPAEYRAETLLQAALELLGPCGDGEAPRVLIPRAAVARDLLPDGLRSAGVSVDVAPVYRAVAPEASRGPLQEALAAGLDAVTFTSSSTVTNFVELAGGGGAARQALRGVTVACIGPISAATATAAGLEVHLQPADYTVEALARALVTRLETVS